MNAALDRACLDAAWEALEAHAAAGIAPLRTLFAEDAERFDRFALRLGDLLVDTSKNRITAETMRLLVELARAADVEAKRDAMFAGERINRTEDRAVLHTALRNLEGHPVLVDGVDVMPMVVAERGRVAAFAEAVRSGAIAGSGGKPFTDVVNIGIGGSDLGPAMATLALSPYAHPRIRSHFVSNVDAAHLVDTLKGLDPATTLFIVASKTFTTLETMTNARSARAWLVAALGEAAVPAHFAALSTNAKAVAEFGIGGERMFQFWDWVGGRYSLWSAISLPLVIAIGEAHFLKMLEGAEAIDRHFRAAPLAANIPVVLALIGIWYRDLLGFPTHAVLPYDQRLARLPAYLQQLDMESNGKRVALDGTPLARPSGPVVWGEPGTNGQHAFFQLIHQGTDVVPADFLIAAEGQEPGMVLHHQHLIANCLAQSEALMRGRTDAEAEAQLEKAGMAEGAAKALAPHKTFPGNRPSTTIAYRQLDPYTLGRILALYEHKVFVQAAIWGINAFDQWGVELGKELAGRLFPVVSGAKPADGLDASTRGLVAHLAALRG